MKGSVARSLLNPLSTRDSAGARRCGVTFVIADGAAAWLFTGLRAYQTARARQFVAHRAWMIRNFALALAAVTLRVQLGTGIASGLSFETVYATVAWASWVPNALVAEWLIRRTRGGATAA